jgi:hypothetical protein
MDIEPDFRFSVSRHGRAIWSSRYSIVIWATKNWESKVTDFEPTKRPLVGTPAYDNWIAFLDGEPCLEAYEYLVYTDIRLTGELATGLEPYALFNLVPFPWPPGRVQAAAALRVSLHVEFETPQIAKTDAARYHGGSMTDEIAALASLKCGIRLRTGSATRIFDVGGDPRGRPIAWYSRPEPTLARGIRGPVLPQTTGERSMMPMEELKSFAAVTPNQAIALVRSARLYQDALWLVESEPHLSWLMLVSAVETAANLWRSETDAPLDRLTASRPRFVEFLRATGVEGLADRVATEFADSFGATKKFVDFLVAYLPPPPEKRPADWGRIDWSPDGLRPVFRKIYEHRSKALHDGIPFPPPMCEPPFKHETWDAVAERPIGLGMSGQGGTWMLEDTPVLLHTFEHIVRHALNAWWALMASPDNNRLNPAVGPAAGSAAG